MIKLSWASSRYELTEESVPPQTSLQLTFNHLTPLLWPCKLLQSLRINSSHATPSPLPVVSGRCIVPQAPIHPEYQPSPTICRFPGRSWYLSISLPPHSKLPSLLSVHTLYPPHCGCFIHIVTQMKKWEREFFWTMANNVVNVLFWVVDEFVFCFFSCTFYQILAFLHLPNIFEASDSDYIRQSTQLLHI